VVKRPDDVAHDSRKSNKQRMKLIKTNWKAMISDPFIHLNKL
jgi:hypothetical protein